MPTLENPEALDSMSDDVDKYMYKKDVKTYAKYNHALTRSDKKLYSLVLVQCTKSLRAKMKGK